MNQSLLAISFFAITPILAKEPAIAQETLILDLDAARGISLDSEQRVIAWKNQASAAPQLEFLVQDKGRSIPSSGCPSLRKHATPNQKPSVVFLQQELVCSDEDFFDDLSTGKGSY
jgi:hypothetical protein